LQAVPYPRKHFELHARRLTRQNSFNWRKFKPHPRNVHRRIDDDVNSSSSPRFLNSKHHPSRHSGNLASIKEPYSSFFIGLNLLYLNPSISSSIPDSLEDSEVRICRSAASSCSSGYAAGSAGRLEPSRADQPLSLAAAPPFCGRPRLAVRIVPRSASLPILNSREVQFMKRRSR
jgi:hypothetical protein